MKQWSTRQLLPQVHLAQIPILLLEVVLQLQLREVSQLQLPLKHVQQVLQHCH